MSSIPLEAGTLVLVPVPYSDLTGQKKRPALVISSRSFNDLNHEFLLCPVTSRIAGGPFNIAIDPIDMAEGEFPVKGEVRANRVHTLHKSAVEKALGRVHERVLLAAIRSVLRALPPINRL